MHPDKLTYYHNKQTCSERFLTHTHTHHTPIANIQTPQKHAPTHTHAHLVQRHVRLLQEHPRYAISIIRNTIHSNHVHVAQGHEQRRLRKEITQDPLVLSVTTVDRVQSRIKQHVECLRNTKQKHISARPDELSKTGQTILEGHFGACTSTAPTFAAMLSFPPMTTPYEPLPSSVNFSKSCV